VLITSYLLRVNFTRLTRTNRTPAKSECNPYFDRLGVFNTLCRSLAAKTVGLLFAGVTSPALPAAVPSAALLPFGRLLL
jgi:hypothetical protein